MSAAFHLNSGMPSFRRWAAKISAKASRARNSHVNRGTATVITGLRKNKVGTTIFPLNR